MSLYDAPVKLISSRAWRTYTGGSQIDLIHGISDGKDEQFPEEWIISTILARNAGREDIEEGMCYLAKDRSVSLKDFILTDPNKALGAKHVTRIGETTGVLVKIIDAAERLTVQVHPDHEKALSLFNSRFGKTECWHILGGRTIDGEKPSIYMGFKEGITREEWKRCFDQQDIPALLRLMHRIEVNPEETYLIKGGVPHAIGKGCLLIEIQEPTDYTIRVERITPKGLKVADMGCHQGLGFEKMFDVFNYDGQSEEEIFQQYRIPTTNIAQTKEFTQNLIIGYQDTTCFKLEKYEVNKDCKIEQSDEFSGLYFINGTGTMTCKGEQTPISAGDQFFIPAASESFNIRNSSSSPLSFFRFFGPKANDSNKA